jgi:hypothetical protein
MYNQETTGFAGSQAGSTAPTPSTLRSLLSEVEEMSRQLCTQACLIGDELFGPRPSAEDSGKDPRGDVRSSIERIRRNLANANIDLSINITAIRGEDQKAYPNQINRLA